MSIEAKKEAIHVLLKEMKSWNKEHMKSRKADGQPAKGKSEKDTDGQDRSWKNSSDGADEASIEPDEKSSNHGKQTLPSGAHAKKDNEKYTPKNGKGAKTTGDSGIEQEEETEGIDDSGNETTEESEGSDVLSVVRKALLGRKK